MSAAGAVVLDVVFDTICPWCYVGKRRLDRALAMRQETPVEVRWRPFLLNPDMPSEGMERRAYMERKYGSSHRVARIERAIAAAGRAEGIPFALDKVARTPNSLPSHRLVRMAAQWGRQSEAAEAVFSAFMVERRDIADPSVLSEIAARLDLPAAAVADADDVDDLRHETAQAHRYGVNGVPCFLFQDRFALSGAQETPILARMIDLAREAALAGEVKASL